MQIDHKQNTRQCHKVHSNPKLHTPNLLFRMHLAKTKESTFFTNKKSQVLEIRQDWQGEASSVSSSDLISSSSMFVQAFVVFNLIHAVKEMPADEDFYTCTRKA